MRWRDELTAATAVIILTLIIGTPSLTYILDIDHGEHAYVASAYLRGKTIYTDVFFVRTPLNYIIYAVSEVLFGHSMMSIRLFDIIWQCATALSILALTNRFYGRKYAGIISAFIYVLLYYSNKYADTAQADGFTTLPVTLALLAYVHAKKSDRPWTWVLCGMLLGTAFTIKYPIAVLVLILLAFMTRREGPGDWPKRVSWMIAGFCVPPLLMTASLAAEGSLYDFLFIQYYHIKGYSSETVTLRIALILYFALTWMPFNLVPLYEAYSLRSRKSSTSQYLILFWWIAGLAHMIVQNKFLLYHRLPMIAPLSIITARILIEMYGYYTIHAPKVRIVFLSILLIAGYNIYVKLGHNDSLTDFTDLMLQRRDLNSIYMESEFGKKGIMNVSDYIRENSMPDDTIIVWGFNAGIYFLSERECASRFPFNYPLYGRYDYTDGFREQYIRELEENRPSHIVIMRNDSMPLLVMTDEDSFHAFLEFKEFHDFTTENYDRKREINDFIIYERK
ncbi:MAG: glycosyltransferase family 39 protein [Candidatus Altiarchaeota archaeon]